MGRTATDVRPTLVVDTTIVNGFRRYRGTFSVPAPAAETTETTGTRSMTLTIGFGQPAASTVPVYIDDISLRYDTFSLPGVNGDPQFVGLHGQNYQVHGIDGAVYNLVSSATTQVNAKFVFLDDGKCPIFDGIPARNCWAHAGSYLGAIGVQQVIDDITHKLAIVSGSSTQGFASVTLDGKSLSVNDTIDHGELFDVVYVSSHVVMVNTVDFAFTFENSDMFINQGVASHRPLSQLTSHGLFGQTHKRTVYPTKVKYIVGDVDDYMVDENDLFGHSFIYNKFHH